MRPGAQLQNAQAHQLGVSPDRRPHRVARARHHIPRHRSDSRAGEPSRARYPVRQAPRPKSQTLMRARTCELLGTRIPGAARTTFFSAGLLSTLDAYFDQPLDVTLRPCHCTRTCGVRSWLTRACRAAFCTPLFARSKLTRRVSTDPSSSDTASPMPALTARIRMRSQCVRRASRSRQPDCPTPPDDHLAAACGPRFRSATNWTHSPTATAERFGIISPDS